MSTIRNYAEVLSVLSKQSGQSTRLLGILNAELSFPNIPFPTMGGEVFWTTLAECDGWKLQQNMFTHHARILDARNCRIAWGTINGMMKAMDGLVDCLHKYGNQ